MSRAPASGPGKEGKVEGSQLRLYKAKEGRNEGMREASYGGARPKEVHTAFTAEKVAKLDS
jgi:hypothetical protein